ncbi:phospholipase D-like domain-containing protein [Streptomyces sp. NPDC016640]|uniref:phospholipase D-like domain-containing protein n=1 Tax=Streptomyces sp. NPDC016640 TaxID=3364969 RepID=UPI0036F57FF7
MTGGAAVRPATGDGDETAADGGPGLARPAGGAAPVAPGRLVTVRNRPWVVTEVTRSALTTDDPARSAGASAPHLVSLASVQDGARDEEPRVVWELEQATGVHDRYELPSPDAGRIGRTGVLHAKVLAADRHTALLGSANPTDRGLSDNIEVGVVLRDPAVVEPLVDHFRRLISPGSEVMRRAGQGFLEDRATGARHIAPGTARLSWRSRLEKVN